MNRASFFCLTLLLPACGLAQGEGFNVRFHLGLPAVILNNVAAADSCYYGAALVADSVPPYRSGAAFIKFGPDGGILDYNWVVDSVSPYETWDGDLVELEGGVSAINGYTYDTVMKALLLFWDADGELIARRSYPNFFSPGEFVRATALARIGSRLVMLSREVDPFGGRRTEFVCSYMDLSGGVVWKKSYGGTTDREVPYSLAALSPDAIALGGWRTNQVAGSEPAPNARDYIVAIDSAGQQQWEYASPLSEYRLGATAMAPGPDGSLIVASGRGQRLEVSPGYYVLEWGIGLIYQLNAEREIAWEVEFTEPQPSFFFNRFHKLIELSDGSGYVAGGDFREPETFDLHGWLVKVSPEGEKLWDRKLRYFPPGDPFYEHTIYDLKEAPGGGFVLAGLADHFGAGWQGQQGWLLKVDEHGCLVPGCELVSTREAGAPPAPALHLYPNPASEALYVLLKDERIAQRQGAQLRLLDVQGRPLRAWPAGHFDEVTSMLPLQGLPAGLYVLQYVGDGQVLGAERVVVR